MQRKITKHRHLKFKVRLFTLFLVDCDLDMAMISLLPTNTVDSHKHLNRITDKALCSIPSLKIETFAPVSGSVSQTGFHNVIGRSVAYSCNIVQTKCGKFYAAALTSLSVPYLPQCLFRLAHVQE